MHQSDFLVIGSGVAGLSYALKVAEHGSVAVITKKETVESNTNYAQGGIAAVMSDADSFPSHIEDTLEAGAGLCDPEVVELVVREGPERVRELMEFGAEFTRHGGRLHLGREGGHSADRIVHAADMTGREIERALLSQVFAHPNIEVFEYHFAVELITEHHLGQHVSRLRPDVHCFGAYVYDIRRDAVETFLSRVTLLAAGGCGQVYLHTTNPDVATGDGVAMAYRAKARVANMEFVQFHPTALYYPNSESAAGYGSDGERRAPNPSFLISEAVRGAGGILYNQGGERFMSAYDARAELAPRDIVARAIDDQLKQRGDDFVLLDISHRPSSEVQEHFPNIYQTCLTYGIDITAQPIPVVPAAHYQCGGVRTDTSGRTSIAGLFACGEVACTGLHGANRLASNSLLEALVFSHRAIDASVAYAKEGPHAGPNSQRTITDVTRAGFSPRRMEPGSGGSNSLRSFREDVPPWDDSGTEIPQEWVLVSHNRDELRRVMWDYVGIVRSQLRLERALRRTRLLFEETEDFFRRSRVSTGLCELRNMIATADLIIRSAQMRRESRGLHFMLDYPDRVEEEKRATLV